MRRSNEKILSVWIPEILKKKVFEEARKNNLQKNEFITKALATACGIKVRYVPVIVTRNLKRKKQKRLNQ